MATDPDQTNQTRRSLLAAAVFSGALSGGRSYAQAPVASPTGSAEKPNETGVNSPAATVLADYIAKALDRALPGEVIARTKLHVLDTFAAIVSGSRLKAGELAARYVDSLGGKPQAMVIGTPIVTSAVNAALANAMAAHADETDDTNPVGPVHLGCGALPAAFATGELAGRSGSDLLRAVATAYDIGARVVAALGIGEGEGTRRHSPSCLTNTFVAAAASAAMLRLDPQQVRHVLSYAAQQASGIGFWTRDHEHVEKAFDFGGMGARNGVTAATMVAIGCSGVDDPFIGNENIFTALADKPSPEKLLAELGSKYAVFGTTIKKWSVGAPLQSVLDCFATLLADPDVRADNIQRIRVEMPTASLRIVDNSAIPDLCLQHLAALMIVDRGASFASVHDAARMSDTNVLAIRKLVELVGSEELQNALPVRQAIVRIDTKNGRSLSHRTYVVRGTAGNPMDPAEVEAKALDLTAPVLGAGRANELIAVVRKLEGVERLTELRPLLRA